MAADGKLPGEQKQASEEPLLSPLRALAIFAVAILALLGGGSLLVGQLTQARAGGAGASAGVVATATTERLSPSGAQPTAAAVPAGATVQVSATLLPTTVPVARLATPPVGQQELAASTGPVASIPVPGELGSAAASAAPRPSHGQTGLGQSAAVNVGDAPTGDDRQPAASETEPMAAAVAAPGQGPGLPRSANLGGSLVPVGPGGVTAPGALRFAQVLAQGARTAVRRPVGSDPALDELARRVLGEELAGAQQRGYPQGDVLSRDGATVRVEVVTVLPQTNTVKLSALPRDTQALGVAAGVAQRIQPGFLPDLVVVAAVSYR